MAVRRRSDVPIRAAALIAMIAAGACQPATPSATPELGFRGLPVDPSLTPLSRSHIDADAQAAFDFCVRPSPSQVVGGARLTSANDVAKYMATNGNEPELQTHAPVWLFQLSGTIAMPEGSFVDPVCVFGAGVAGWFGPFDAAGSPVTFPGMTPPIFSLPPLQP